MIKYAEVENCDAAICVIYEQFHFTALVLAYLFEIALWYFLSYGPAI